MWMQNRINQTLNSPDALPRLEQILSQAERETGSEVGRRVCAALDFVDGHGRFQRAGCLRALRAAAVAPRLHGLPRRRWSGPCPGHRSLRLRRGQSSTRGAISTALREPGRWPRLRVGPDDRRRQPRDR